MTNLTDFTPARVSSGRRPAAPRLPGALLSAYVEAARGVEIDPYAQLRRRRLPTEGFEEVDVTVSLEDLLELVERTAALARRPDFALRLASAIDLAAFGPIVLLASLQPTVREALALLCAHGSGRGSPVRVTRLEERETTILQLTLRGGEGRGAFASELALGLALRAMQSLLGPGWRPRRTEFGRHAPADKAPYEAVFGAVVFGGRDDAITFPSTVLERRCPLRSPALARLVEQQVRLRGESPNEDFADQVRGLIEALLSRGHCSAERIAAQLGVDRRTVHRRLAERGLSISALELAARRGIVEAELRDPQRSIAIVARRAGISNLSAFSRWFRRVYGQSPREYRSALQRRCVTQ
jgi:AraC-like DNA-binding protein